MQLFKSKKQANKIACFFNSIQIKTTTHAQASVRRRIVFVSFSFFFSAFRSLAKYKRTIPIRYKKLIETWMALQWFPLITLFSGKLKV